MNRNLLESLPEINRARGYRLYSSGNKRIVDFYQDSGNAVMGHRLSGISLSMKQVIDKGVFFSCRTRYDVRLGKAVKTLAGKDIKYSLFSGLKNLFSDINHLLPTFFPSVEEDKSGAAFWHPFSGDNLNALLDEYSYVIPVIPFPGSFSPCLLLSKKASVPEGEMISPVLLSPFISAVYKLIEKTKYSPYDFWDDDTVILKKLWSRKGAYLIPSYNPEQHENIFSTFLEKGYLISPDFNIPSILPAEISKGEKDIFLNTVNNLSGEISK